MNRSAPILAASALALLSLAACRGGEGARDGESQGESVDLPAMSPGTIQAIGPHVFTSSLETSGPDDGEDGPAKDRLELVFEDISHYRMSRWSDGALDLEEYREDDLFVFRRSKGPFRWGQAVAGSSYLLDTIHPFERGLNHFSAELVIEEIETREEDPETFRRFRLGLRASPEDTEQEPRSRGAGHSALPLTLTGEVTTDEFGNRRQAQLEGTFLDRGLSGFDEDPTTIIYFESRVAAPEGVGLMPPAAATPMIFERKAERARVDTSKTAPIP
jgi:hypothetical protein